MTEESLVSIPEQDQQPEQASESASTSRPDWLPEKYWNDENGQADVKAIVDALAGTQTALRNRKEEMRKEIEDELAADTPPEPDSYKIELEEFPEAANLRFDDNDPLVASVRVWAHENKISQKAFNGLLSKYASAIVKTQPNKDKEIAALGERAQERLNRLGSLAGRALTDEADLAEFANMSMTARQIAVLEKLIDIGKATSPQSFESDEGTLEVTEEELHRIMASDAYWSRDEATMRKAQRLQERLSKFRKRA